MIAATPKGFKDYLPEESLKRRYVIERIISVFQKFGFDPLETPTIEYEETLAGKYGEEERLIYKFETIGGDRVALKYDQTVPLARVIAQYGPKGQQILPMPFKRYQIQSAYRGENTQKGRYREFLQCDGDIVGVFNPLADAEILAVVYEIYRNLGLKVIIKVNDRLLLKGIEPKYLAALDKLNKVGQDGVLKELQDKGLEKKEAVELFERITQNKESGNLNDILNRFEDLGYSRKDIIEFDPTLIRGLDYYTGLIFEVVLANNRQSSSLCGGGRWDNMIEKFTGLKIPAVGFAIGLDRTIEAMEEDGVLNTSVCGSKVLVTVFSAELMAKSVDIVANLRRSNIASEVWLDENDKLDKQLKYADKKGIPYAIVIGPDEQKLGKLMLKDLKKRTQEKLSLDEVLEKLAN